MCLTFQLSLPDRGVVGLVGVAALGRIYKTVSVLTVGRGEKGRRRHRGNDLKWSSNMLLIHSEVKQAAHALADLGLEGVFANDVLN